MKTAGRPVPPVMTNDALVPLIPANEKKNFIEFRGDKKKLNLLKAVYFEQCHPTVIDDESLKLIQVLQLHAAIDHTDSVTGSAVLLRSLIQPGTDLQTIRRKQASLSEIAANDNLRRTLKDFVNEFSSGENALYKFFNKGLVAMFPYPDLGRARKAAANMARITPAIPRAESAYLKALLARLDAYRGSPVDQMMVGAIHKTFGGLKSKDAVGVFTPKIKFIPRRFTRWAFAGPAVALMPYVQNKIGLAPVVSPLLTHIGLAWTGLSVAYALVFKPIRDTFNFIEPFRVQCIDDPVFNGAVDAVGMIDELLSCHDYANKSQHTAILPRVTDGEHHHFDATGLKNPVLANDRAGVVPNDVRMNGARLTFVSGPNSGGKTTLCKSIVQNQLLAQAGAYVLADKATINIADRIRYQAPKFDGLQDDEGRFGTELGRTRDIFYATGPRSLVILDELAEGTTYEERLHESHGILSDFHTIGNNTVLVTHNHSLVDKFMAEEKGQCLMAEFKEGQPTYRIVPGISRVSHAARIAEKIKFSRADRRRYLERNGYL
jgi:DNA mismatch repair protein MutS